MTTLPESTEILALVRISSCVALRDETKLRNELLLALQEGISLQLIRETILQSYLFAGYAAAINAFIVLNAIIGEDPEFWQEVEDSAQKWKVRGEELCRKIYGSQYEKLFHNMKQLHPDLADWMISEGYGKVLARPFLSPVVRELLIVALTAVLQVERQFYSHVRGALNVGALPEQVLSVFDQTRPYIAEEKYEHYQLILNGLIRS